jgi:hypothetical protein
LEELIEARIFAALCKKNHKMNSPESTVWSTSSLFCSKKNWHLLLQSGIKPLLQKTVSDNGILTYKVKLNYKRGENIRLAWLTDLSNAESTAKQIDAYFTDYFKASGFSGGQVPFYGTSIFMPFPVNTVQYGLYSIYSNDFYDLEEGLSDAMTMELSENDLDDESILTFAFYLNLSAIKSLLNYCEGMIDWVKANYIHNGVHESAGVDLLKIGYEVDKNKAMIVDIAKDVFAERRLQDANFMWLEKWERACYNMYAQNSFDGMDAEQLQVAYFAVLNIIKNNLSLREEEATMLDLFIKECLPVVSYKN